MIKWRFILGLSYSLEICRTGKYRVITGFPFINYFFGKISTAEYTVSGVSNAVKNIRMESVTRDSFTKMIHYFVFLSQMVLSDTLKMYIY